MNTEYNFLVVWNPLTALEENKIEKFLNNLLNQIVPKKSIKWKFVFSEGQLEVELNKHNVSHVIVLCELTWGNRKFAQFYGVELVQQQIRVKFGIRKPVDLPILFVSFCSRTQILITDQTKEIISTFGLSNHFIQLPIAKDSEIQDFWIMKPATELEMIDTLHFCEFDKMVRSIRHFVESLPLDVLKDKLLSVLSKLNDTLLTDFEVKTKQCQAKEQFKLICDEIESILSVKLTDSTQSTSEIEYKVLLVEDEDSDNMKDFINEARKFNLIIDHYKTTSEAYIKLKDDFMNHYQVVISDYRIYDNPAELEKKLMLYPQGYTFIDQTSKLGHLYKFIAFSGLPRAFRIAVAEKLNVRIETVDKELMMSTDKGRKSFINKIIDLAEENRELISGIASNNYYFKTLYKRTITEKISIEDQITIESIKLINMLNICLNMDETRTIDEILLQDVNLGNPIYVAFQIKENELIHNVDNLFAQYWKKIKSNFSIQSETESQKADHDFYSAEIAKVVNAVKASLRRYSKANETIESAEFNSFVLLTINTNSKLCRNIYTAFDPTCKEIFKEIILANNIDDNITLAEQIYSRILENPEAYQNLVSNFKNDTYKLKDLYSEDALEKFIGKLIVRRFAIYSYYWIEKYIDITKVTDMKGLTHAVNRLLIKGYLGKKGGTDSGITTNNLFLSVRNKKIKAICKFQHIALTNEEKNFFLKNYPDLFEKWNRLDIP